MMDTIANFLKDLEMKSLEGSTNIIDILKADHRKVDVLFKQFEKTEKGSDKQRLLDLIVKELSVHATVEEEFVYPLIDKLEHGKTNEALEEHHVVKLLLAELADIPAGKEEVKAKVCVLSEMVRHHIKEEEGDLLPKLKKSGADLDAVGKRVMQRKQKLMMGITKVGDKTGKQIGGSPKKTTSRSSQSRKKAS